MGFLQIGIVGGGTMGGGIAAHLVKKGLPVVLKEANQNLAETTKETFIKYLEARYRANKIELADLQRRVSLFTVTADLNDLAEADLIIEAVTENMELKKKIFRELDLMAKPEVILTSNTSCLPVTEISEATRRPDRVMGTHFFNPPTCMLLVELIKGQHTSPQTAEAVKDFIITTAGKVTIDAKDRPGFLINCLLLPYLGEAILALGQNDITIEEVDAQAVNFGWPMGPFTLLDTIGLDTALFVAQFLAQAYPGKIVRSSLFELLVGMGRWGNKTGVGFYGSSDEHEALPVVLNKRYGIRLPISAKEVFDRMMARFLNEAVGALEVDAASKEDIELGCQIGLGCPGGGPLHIIDSDQMGAAKLVEQLVGFESQCGSRFTPAKRLVKMAGRGEKFFESW